MDFLPLFIHFPIAFLVTYSAFELLRFNKVLNLPHWFYIKATLVILGELGAIATLIVARASTEALVGTPLTDTFRDFTLYVVIVFSIISIAYLYEWFRPNKFSLYVMRPSILIPLVVIGLFTIVTTGGLYGAMIFGTHFDPYMAPVYKLLNVY